MRSTFAVIAAAAVLVLLALPGGAGAATVTAHEHWFETGTKPSRGTLAGLNATPGVANRLTIRAESRRFVLRDGAERLEAGRGCRALAGGAVACRTQGGWFQLHVDTGDGDDRVEVAGDGSTVQLDLRDGADVVTATGATPLVVLGGPGDDLLGGGAGSDWLIGDEGADRIAGGGGDDQLVGGTDADELSGQDGDDTLVGETTSTMPSEAVPPVADRLDGGAGLDIASYAARRAPVAVDLVTGVGSEGGVVDALVSVEGATGGLGADTLLGDDGPNRLDGGSARDYEARPVPSPPSFGDLVDGRGGDDDLKGGTAHDVAGALVGGPGDDRLDPTGATAADGGTGHDVLDAEYGVTGPFGCGEGVDAVLAPAAGRVVGVDCERVDLTFFAVTWPVRDGDRLRVTLSRRPHYDRSACGVHVQLRDAATGAVLAGARTRLARRQPRELTLDAGGRGGLAGREQVRVAVRPGVCPGGTGMRPARGSSWETALLALPAG